MTEVINKIIITEAAKFDYENTDFFGERRYPSWEELLAEFGCDMAQALKDAGYDRRAAFVKAGCVWKECMKNAGGNKTAARLKMDEARTVAGEFLKAAYRKAEKKTERAQIEAFALAKRYDKPLRKLKQQPFKNDIEEYIDNLNRAGLMLWEHYFRCNYYDEALDRMLMLFLYRDRKDGAMQNWRLQGICLADDRSEEAEDDGRIRNRLKSPYWESPEDAPPDEDDWVVKDRVREIIEHTEKTKFENVLKEVQDAFTEERDKEFAEELLLLQSIGFKRRKREQTQRKSRRGGKMPKRT